MEETLKLKVNREKSRTVSVFAIRNFKFLGFCFGKSGKGIYIRVHGKSWKKAKEKLRQFTSRSKCGSIIRAMEKIKVYMRGWLNYYGIADVKNNIESLDGWLYRRIRMCIWKQLLWSSIFVTLVAKKYHESVTLPSGLRMVYDNH